MRKRNEMGLFFPRETVSPRSEDEKSTGTGSEVQIPAGNFSSCSQDVFIDVPSSLVRMRTGALSGPGPTSV